MHVILLHEEYGMSQSVDFKFLMHLIDKFWKSILVSIVLGGVFSSLIATFIVKPSYESTVQILVNRRSSSSVNQITNQQADVQMIATYKELISNQVILKPTQKALKEKYDYNYDVSRLKQAVNVISNQNSQVFSINVRDSNSVISAEIANQIAKTFQTQVKKIIKVDNVTIVSSAVASNHPVAPNKIIYLAIGLFCGLILGLFYSGIKVLTDRKVQDQSFITDELDLALLGVVNHQKNTSKLEEQLKQLRYESLNQELSIKNKRIQEN